MSREDITRMALEAGFETAIKWAEHPNGFIVVVERFFHLAYAAGRKAEQDRCCAIVIGLAGSDNVAHRTVKAIRSDK